MFQHHLSLFKLIHQIPRFTCPIDGKALQVDQLNQPNSQFLNFYINLELKCKYLDDGCKEVLSVALIESHEKNCWHRIKECVHNNCSLSEEAPGKELHKATCTNRLLECDHCHNHIQYWNMVTHRYKTCPETEVLCECGQIITRRLLNSHYADECANTVFKYHLIDCAERFQMSEPKKYISDPKRLTFLCNQVENIKPTMEKTVEKLIERNMEKTTETIMEQLTKQLEEMQTNISLIQDKTKVVQLQTQKYLHWQMSKNPKTIHWIIEDPDLSAANKEYIESPEFYSFPSGICFGVKVYMNGVNEESMGFISVHFYLRSGLFDDDISWPFDKKVTVDLKVGQGAGYSLQRSFFDASRGSEQEIFKKAGRPKKN
eukprot:Ihof_evm1s813 gene=Ihof_evmTU1s813